MVAAEKIQDKRKISQSGRANKKSLIYEENEIPHGREKKIVCSPIEKQNHYNKYKIVRNKV